MSTRIHLVVSDELLARVDAARGDVGRSTWIRRAVEFRLVDREIAVGRGAVEQALSEANGPVKHDAGRPGSVSSLEGVRSAASAEQPWDDDEAHRRASREYFSRVRSSSEARPFRPAPKKGKP